MIELRDYQKSCINVIDSLERGSGLISMATGLGKTVVFSRIKRRGRVLILSHREELVYQPIKYYDCKCGIEKGELRSNGEEVVSASVQSLVRRLDDFSPTAFDMIITDEAHHAAAPSYKKIYAHFKPRVHLGFTATPNRGDKVRLDDVFDEIIFERDLKWGIQNGFLSDIRCLRVKVSYDVSKVKRKMGDFQTGELEKAVNTTTFNKEVADVYRKYAKGQTLIFASSVSHAENIAKNIEGAVVVSQKTKNRKKIIDDFTKRKIPCIVNCMIFTEGTDIPLVETIIIARPTQNSSLYTQMVGRGLRLYEGKKYLTLIDLVGVTEKNDICTAPSLMGLDLKLVPKYKLDDIQGMLTDMGEIIETAMDSPSTWVLNASSVNLFAREQHVNLHSINWIKKSNGDLVYQFNCGDRIGIKAIDELGRTILMRYYYNEKSQRFEYSESSKTTLQQALDWAYRYFTETYSDERSFWDLDAHIDWQYEPATEKQLNYIKGKISEIDWVNLVDGRQLTKLDATQIINSIFLRDLKPQDLLKMHKRNLEKKMEAKVDNEIMSKLKIRMLIDKKKTTHKFYAIKHITDLAITNNWDWALGLISSLDGVQGKKVQYKSFRTLKDAQNYLRNID